MNIKLIVLSIVSFVLIASLSTLGQRKKKPDELNLREINYETIDVKDTITFLKKQTKDEVAPYRYDASVVTFFVYKTFTQRKEVEIFFFNNVDYKIVINTGAILDDIDVEIWDKPQSFHNKTLLYSKKGVSTGIFHVNSYDLLQSLKEKKMSQGMSEMEANQLRLKKAYVSYIIPDRKKEEEISETGQITVYRYRGAVVMALGYKNV